MPKSHIITESSYFINEDFPFPIKATLYSPHVIFPKPLPLFSFELENHYDNTATYFVDNSFDVDVSNATIRNHNISKMDDSFGWDDLNEDNK